MADYSQQMASMFLKKIVCWLLGHRWKFLPYEIGPGDWSYERQECMRCGTIRRELVAGRLDG